MPIPAAQGLGALASAQLALYRGDPAKAEADARVALAALVILLPYRFAAYTTLVRALLSLGRLDAARATAEEALSLLLRLGGTGFTEVELRLCASEAFFAAGDRERAQAELAQTLRQVRLRADKIYDPAWKQSYLLGSPACARALELERAWNNLPSP